MTLTVEKTTAEYLNDRKKEKRAEKKQKYNLSQTEKQSSRHVRALE
jgi:hypothetical protein